MAYRVWVGSIPIDCDTPDAAFEMARRIEENSATSRSERATHPTGNENTSSRWTIKRVNEFFKLIDGNQRKIIDVLLEHGDAGRTDQQLLALLGLTDGRALGGVFGGIWKNAKKAGADPNDLYERKSADIGGRKVSEYFLKGSFRKAAEARGTE